MDAELSQPAPAWTAPFAPGDIAPWFDARTPVSPRFYVSTVAGRYVVLGFTPPPGPERDAAFAAFHAHRRLFDDQNLTAFCVLTDAASIGRARNQPPGLRWFLDDDGRVSRLYGAISEDGRAQPYWILLDPMLRVLRVAPVAESAAFFAGLADLPPAQRYAGADLAAPTLIVPRVFDPDLCRRLIAHYEAVGGTPSGVMRDIDGKTVGVLDSFKKRRDVFMDDSPLQPEILHCLRRRLFPEIQRVFQFEVTRLERYLIACYDGEEGGYFRAHRDNETFATLHRRFAVTINLNAEDFEGGDLTFPEFGGRSYRAPTGGAVVFACGLLHEATPVTKGRRYAFLPFLYDEAGRAIREANAGALATLETAETPEGGAPDA